MTANRPVLLLVFANFVLPQLPILAQQSPVTRAAQAREVGTQASTPEDIEKLKVEIRQLKEQLIELRRQTQAIENHLTFGPDVEVQNEDYAKPGAGSRADSCERDPLPKTGHRSRHLPE